MLHLIFYEDLPNACEIASEKNATVLKSPIKKPANDRKIDKKAHKLNQKAFQFYV